MKVILDCHDTHCCIKHGCKYSREDCPVEKGLRKQVFPCEYCHDDETDINLLWKTYSTLRRLIKKYGKGKVLKLIRRIENESRDGY